MKHVQCPDEFLADGRGAALFLAGGITSCPDWQIEMVHKLAKSNLTLLNPKRQIWDVSDKSLEVAQIEWEHRHQRRADAILFWFPPDTLCPITLYELGAWNFRPKRLFIGCHSDYKRKRDVEIQTRLERPGQVIVDSLDDLATQVMQWDAERAN